ncbi:hypothetical protein [Paracidovorax sp. MALMAid1276]|uniref:hypothetical protein n=1 Tax=Paracidovorax sp. MALMAid1276 TaxID=3411631 RepID=UPI003B9CBF08
MRIFHVLSLGAACLLVNPVMAGAATTGHANALLPEIVTTPMPPQPMAEDEKHQLAHAMAMTPYTVVVVHTRLTIVPIPSPNVSHGLIDADQDRVMTEERHIYEAQVVETLRGPAMKRIRYEVLVDRGDSASLSTQPAIVMVCRGPRGFYWGGVGAHFKASREAVALARRVAKDLAQKPATKFGYCD